MIKTEDLQFGVGDFCLNAPDVHILKGEYFVLLGPPGSGKSVFLEC